MVETVIAILAVGVLAAMSVRANRRFAGVERLPMQWSLPRTVIWTAPRAFALAFTPALAAIVLAAVVLLQMFTRPRPGQEGLEIPILLFVALVFIGAHALHLWLIQRSLRGSR